MVELFDNALPLSPYNIQNLKVNYHLDGMIKQDIPDDNRIKVLKRMSHMLSLESVENLAPFSSLLIRIHFKHDTALPIFHSAKVEIEVSHWGNIQVRGFFRV